MTDNNEQVEVSVVIPCFNAERTIRRAIESVQAQEMAGTEIVVVDDGSYDASRDIVRLCPGVHLIELPRNRGVSHARNAGIEVARGRYIAFLDADDEWRPGKLARQLRLIKANPRMSMVACGAEMISFDGQVLPVFAAENVPVAGADAWRALLAYPFVLTSTVVARAALLKRVGGFDERLPTGEDQDMWIRLALAGELGYDTAVLVTKHEHRQSLSNRTPWGFRFVLHQVRRHVERNRHRLSPDEIRRIYGRRMTLEGRNAYYNGLYGAGFRMLARAIVLSHEPLRNAAFLVRHAPPARWLKRRVLANTQTG